MNAISKYVESILVHVECGVRERDDLQKELSDHIHEAKSDYVREGLSEQEATERAIREFGEAEKVGDGLQKTLSPVSKPLFLILGLLSIVYGCSVYLYGVVRLSEPHPIWLSLTIMLGLAFIITAFYPSLMSRKKVLICSLLVLMLPAIYFGLLITDTANNAVRILFSSFGLGLLLLAVISFFTVMMRNPNTILLNRRERRFRLLMHIINMITGILVLSDSSILLFGMLWFGFVFPRGLLPFVLTGIWIALYALQVRFFRLRKRTVGKWLLVCQTVLGVIMLTFFIIIFR